MNWFTSDPHFYHHNVIRFCNRPFKSVEEMNEALINNWNKVVNKKDNVFVVGDFAFCDKTKMKSILSQLKGNKILVKGNHDKDARYMLEAGFNKVIENEKIKINGIPVLLSHFPYHPTFWLKLKTQIMYGKYDTRYLHKRIKNNGEWLIHGHVHTAWAQNGKQINVGVDVRNYTPVSEHEIYNLIKK